MAPKKKSTRNSDITESSTIEETMKSKVEEAMAKFSFPALENDEFSQYIARFERMCRVKGLTGNSELISNAKRDLLLAFIGCEPLKKIEDYFYPENVDSVEYDTLVAAFNSLYKPTKTLFTARIEFDRLQRTENESINSFVSRLKHVVTFCKYEPRTVDERLRDRFIAGLNHSKTEIEARMKWPEGKQIDGSTVSLNDVVSMALSVELAEREVSQPRLVRKLETVARGKRDDCFRCGRSHGKEDCPAQKFPCNFCKRLGHFEKFCKKKKSLKVRKIDDGEKPESPSTEESETESDEVCTLKKINHSSKRVTIDVTLNDVDCRMEYDTGARVSTISEQFWSKIGNPPLKPSRKVNGYGRNPLKVCGKCNVDVNLNGTIKTLPVVVMDEDDEPLFGLPWIEAFKLPLPREVSIHKVSSIQAEEKRDNTELEKLLKEFDDLFEVTLGTIKDREVRLHIKSSAEPVALKARRVPFPLRQPIEQELARLEKEGVIEKVDPAKIAIEWSTPIVPVKKKSGEVRICGDYRVTINPAMVPNNHTMPTFDDLASKLVGGEEFSVVDLRDAYLQMKVAEESQLYLTIATHAGYYKYLRMPFGISTAPAIFQRTMEDILKDIDHVGINMDDVVITGRNRAEHLKNLRQVFVCLQNAGVKVKREKCQFLQKSVCYVGHKIDKEGIHPMDSKVDAIKNCPSPKNITELRSFLGMVNYLEKFIPFLHGKCAPLHRLTGTRTPWKWSDAEERTFQEIKSLISKEDTVVPYDRNKSIVIAADASENGLGAVICQRDENGNERPIAYGSRTLNDAEKHYASIDREAAALVFAVTKFHQYVYGKKFILVTDHKPLVRIFGCKRDLPKVTNNRLVRWALSLGSYDYDIEYRSGKENMIADFLSRMPLEGQPVHKEEQIKILNCNEDDILISRDRLKKESKKDPILRKIIQWVSTTWPQETTLEEIRPYFKRKDEISVEEGVVVWGGRIIIPSALQHETLDHLHQGHPGISAMKGLGRFYVWWPNFDKDVEEYVKSCVSCQEFRDQDYEVPLYPWNIPDKVWDRVHLDFAGPIDGVYWLVGIDAHSRWVEVEVMKSITSKNLISRLTEWFSRYGYPKMIVSDNGAQFTSGEFEQFVTNKCIKHVCVTPWHPKSNGMAERVIRTLKRRYKATKKEVKDTKIALLQVLFAYRTAPHNSTGRSPASMFFGRKLPTIFDMIKPTVKETLEAKQTKQAYYHDQTARKKDFLKGEEVWARDTNKKIWEPGSIHEKKGPISYLVNIGGVLKRKHADHLRSRVGAMDNGLPDIDDERGSDIET